MNVFDRSWREPAADEVAWFDSLPVGTFVTPEALRRFSWPIDPDCADRWLRVKCVPEFSYPDYVRWLSGLPRRGVIVDPADARHLIFMASAMESVISSRVG